MSSAKATLNNDGKATDATSQAPKQNDTRDEQDPETPVNDEKETSSTLPNPMILHGFRLGAVVAGVCLGSLMISLDVTIIATVSIDSVFHLSHSTDFPEGNSISHIRVW